LQQSRRHAQRLCAQSGDLAAQVSSESQTAHSIDLGSLYVLRLGSPSPVSTPASTSTTVMTVIQRPLKGSRLSSFYPVKSLPSLSSLDSAFQLQEYISLLIRFDVHDVQRIISLPGKFSNTQDTGTPLEELKDEEKDSDRDGKGDVTVEEPCWIYEQLRSVCLLASES
jgi:hypothetical protein